MTTNTIRQLVSRGARPSRRLAISLLVASAAAVALLSGGPAAHPSAANASGAMLQVHAGDFSFDLDHASVTPGPVRIAFFNDSTTFPHEVFNCLFGRTPAFDRGPDRHLGARWARERQGLEEPAQGLAGGASRAADLD